MSQRLANQIEDLNLKENINKKRRKLKIEENFCEFKEIKDK